MTAKKNYLEKLKDPRWQRKKNSILDRDNYTCMKCGDTTTTLHVHHIYYKPNHDPWQYSEDELETLCEVCHEKVTKENKEFGDELKKLSYHFGLENTVFLIAFFMDMTPRESGMILDFLYNGNSLQEARNYKLSLLKQA